MDKKYIVRFLKERKRGVYTLIVNMYVDVVTNMPVTMALQVIKDDLQKETGDSLELNYFSLAKAVSKLENRISRKSTTTEIEVSRVTGLGSSEEHEVRIIVTMNSTVDIFCNCIFMT